MKEEKATRSEQQDANAALAALAAAGNSFALGQLWEINKGVIRRQLWQWYEKNKPVADGAGLSFEDLVQEGYFAVDYAAKHYSAEQGNFTTYLSYALLNQIRKATCGEHTRWVTTEDGRRVQKSQNLLNECASLDTPLDDTDGGGATLGDLQEDPAASQAFQQTEDDIYTQELHAALEEALTRLTAKQAGIIRRHYFEGKSLAEIAAEDGTTRSAPNTNEQAAFLALRRSPVLARWHDDIITTRAWRGTGWGAWNRYGSVEERATEYWDKLWEEYKARARERATV